MPCWNSGKENSGICIIKTPCVLKEVQKYRKYNKSTKISKSTENYQSVSISCKSANHENLQRERTITEKHSGKPAVRKGSRNKYK